MEKIIHWLTDNYASFIALGLVFTLLESQFPLNSKTRPFNKNQFFQDLFWSVLNNVFVPLLNGIMRVIFFASIAIYTNRVLPLLGEKHFFYLDLKNISFVGIETGNIYLQVVCIFLLRDFLGYVFHRFVHQGWLWTSHALHHSSQNVNWLSAERGHWLEQVLAQIFVGSAFFIFKTSDQMIAYFYLLEMFVALYGHSNTRISIGFLKRWVQNPLVHHWHHAELCHFKTGQNFGNCTLIWDHVFKTFYLPENEQPPLKYGILQPNSYPENMLKRFFYPFIKAEQSGLK